LRLGVGVGDPLPFLTFIVHNEVKGEDESFHQGGGFVVHDSNLQRLQCPVDADGITCYQRRNGFKELVGGRQRDPVDLVDRRDTACSQLFRLAIPLTSQQGGLPRMRTVNVIRTSPIRGYKKCKGPVPSLKLASTSVDLEQLQFECILKVAQL
jgi:hypothetical protein